MQHSMHKLTKRPLKCKNIYLYKYINPKTHRLFFFCLLSKSVPILIIFFSFSLYCLGLGRIIPCPQYCNSFLIGFSISSSFSLLALLFSVVSILHSHLCHFFPLKADNAYYLFVKVKLISLSNLNSNTELWPAECGQR